MLQLKKKREIHKRITAILFAVIVCITTVQFAEPLEAAEPSGNLIPEEAAVNLIENGDFTDGFQSWEVYFNESHSGEADVTSDFMANIKISFFLNWYDANGNDNGPVTWSTMLNHTQIPVEKGKKYKVSFLANSTVKRPIKLELGNRSYFFALDEELKEYTAEYDNTDGNSGKIDFKFHLGPIARSEAGNDTGIGITETDGHYINFADIAMWDTTTGTEYVRKPVIIGVDDNETYHMPVTPSVYYRKAYNIRLTRDGQEAAFAIDEGITDNGNYVLTVTDAQDSSIKTEKKFTIAKNIDYSKEYYVIESKATKKVMEARGVKDGGVVVQSTFAGKAGQFFTIEPVEQGYFVLRALSSGKVVQVAGGSKDNNAKLEQGEYTGANSQLWRKISVPQGYVKLQNRASGKVIDIAGGQKTENLVLQQYDNSGNGDEGQSSADGQRFDLIRMDNVKSYIEPETVVFHDEEEWKKNAFITPVAEKLNAAGPVAVEWYAAPGNVQSYDIYFDGEKKKTVAATGEHTLKTEDQDIYSTKVAAHTMKIVASYAGNRQVETNEIKFFISKKGVGWSTLHRTQDMNLSWYYNWSLYPSTGTDENLKFVPMVWGNFGDEWLADTENKKYGTVLAFNESDWSDQSNVPVTKALAEAWAERYNAAHPGENMKAPKSLEESWQPFMDSGLRIGSPATALAPPVCNGTVTMNEVDGKDDWWQRFDELMKEHDEWDYDFVALHSYNQDCDAKGFLAMIDETYAMTGKPIWITEHGVARWDQADYAGNVADTQKKVKEFMIEVIEGLEERDFVERYAWFPFDPNDAYGGASGIFDYASGELNELGKTYAMLGLPEGYKGAEYDVDDRQTEQPAEPIEDKADTKPVKEDETQQPPAVVKPTVKWNVSYKTCPLQLKKSTKALKAVGIRKGDKIVSYKSSNKKVAAVSANGTIKAKKVGTATITVTTLHGASAKIKIKVQKKPVKVTKLTVKNVKNNKLFLKKGKTKQLSVEKKYITATDKITYRSSNKKVATVTSKGKIRARRKGTAVITVKCGKKVKKIKVTVKK